MWDEFSQVEIHVRKPDVSIARHSSVFTGGTEHMEFQHFAVWAFDTRKYINDQEERLSLALEHVFCNNMLFRAFMPK